MDLEFKGFQAFGQIGFLEILYNSKTPESSVVPRKDFSKAFENKWVLQLRRIFASNAYTILEPLSVTNLILTIFETLKS